MKFMLQIWNLEDKLRKYTTCGDYNYKYALKELLKEWKMEVYF
jgi:hypothetical protein